MVSKLIYLLILLNSFFAESDLGQVARNSALEIPRFSEDAQDAFARLTPLMEQRTLDSGDVVVTDFEAEQQELITIDSLPVYEDQEEVLEEEPPVNEQWLPEEAIVPLEDETIIESDCEVSGDQTYGVCKPEEVSDQLDDESENMSEPVNPEQTGIDLNAALIGFSAWAVAKPSRKQGV